MTKHRQVIITPLMCVCLCVFLQGDKSNSFLRAARAGDTEKVSKYLRNSSFDVNACNDVRYCCLQITLLTLLPLFGEITAAG